MSEVSKSSRETGKKQIQQSDVEVFNESAQPNNLSVKPIEPPKKK